MRTKVDLHQGLCIITCPLLEISSSMEFPLIRKWWDCSNTKATINKISLTEFVFNTVGISPSINFIHHDFCIIFTICLLKICFHPIYKMIFECTFDYLMIQIWSNKLMYICSWECSCERLNAQMIHILIPLSAELACHTSIFAKPQASHAWSGVKPCSISSTSC